jgi:glutathione S-transferase
VKLYSSPISPFAARVRIAIRYKGVDCELVAPPPTGLKGPEYLALNPMGKLPLLVLDDGSTLPESETILEYLEDAFPDRPLRPADPLGRARMRTFVRVTENYVTTPMVRLFPQLDPTVRRAEVVTQEVERLQTGLGNLEHYVSGDRYLIGRQLSLADCCVLPTLHLCRIVATQLGITDVLGRTPRLARYFEGATADPWLRSAHDEIEAALASHAAA